MTPVCIDILLYTLVLVIQAILSSRKQYIFGIILPILTTIYFLISKDMNGYNFLCYELLMLGLIRIIFYIVESSKIKKTKIDKSIIMDL